MLCGVINAPTVSLAIKQVKEHISEVQIFEIRLDCIEDWKMGVHLLKETLKVPVIWTIRSTSQGGYYEGDEEEYQRDIEYLLTVKPEYIDVEWGRHEAILQGYSLGDTKVIVSYHAFDSFPDLEALYEKMRLWGDFHKIAAICKSSIDALKMLSFQRDHAQAVVVPMGEKGSFGRVLAKILGSKLTYCALSAETKAAPGQLAAKELNETYRHKTLNPNTEIFALIGSPVNHSIGHIFHNDYFEKHSKNAVYVKVDVDEKEVEEFFKYADQLNFIGLSVTTPLKELVIPFLDKKDETVNAVHSCNTVLLSPEDILGCNTDGAGALDAIEDKLSVVNKLIVILSTGPTARSCAFEALKRGAEVLFVSRGKEKESSLIAPVITYEELKTLATKDRDVIILNASPVEPVLDLCFKPVLAMDVNYKNQENAFLKQFQDQGIPILTGRDMFEKQALKQQQIWASLD